MPADSSALIPLRHQRPDGARRTATRAGCGCVVLRIAAIDRVPERRLTGAAPSPPTWPPSRRFPAVASASIVERGQARSTLQPIRHFACVADYPIMKV